MNNGYIRKEFTSEEIIQKKNYADLLEYGEFKANYIEIDPEDDRMFYATGTLRCKPRNVEKEVEIENAELEIYIDWRLISEDKPAHKGLENLTAGQIFNLPWENWYCYDIPTEWEF